jgi:hypothetical protein
MVFLTGERDYVNYLAVLADHAKALFLSLERRLCSGFNTQGMVQVSAASAGRESPVGLLSFKHDKNEQFDPSEEPEATHTESNHGD